ncbi:MAG: hypothetical protein CMH62_01715 [Nanoarchaeota archaeon]|nr:hypothetical protein [Nanoarchaeota archaeon]|tara:strand:+ start:641 stop:1012 length:372 start_codon:yes stop_codon:yes gene_type:complete
MLKNLDNKSLLLLGAIAFSLVVGFSDELTGDTIKKNSQFFIERGNHIPSESQCDRFNGEVLVSDVIQIINGKEFELSTSNENLAVVRIDNTKRTLRPGHEFYMEGLFVTLLSSTEKDVCLIIE